MVGERPSLDGTADAAVTGTLQRINRLLAIGSRPNHRSFFVIHDGLWQRAAALSTYCGWGFSKKPRSKEAPCRGLSIPEFGLQVYSILSARVRPTGVEVSLIRYEAPIICHGTAGQHSNAPLPSLSIQ